MDNIVLIGFMGCGKTTVGIRLSYALQRSFLDTDRQIEREQGKEIAQIFAEEGEAAFRGLETEMIAKMAEKERGRIISTGGGLPVKQENRVLLKKLGTVVYLKTTPETVYERVKDDTKRPLLQCGEPLRRIRELMAERESAYMAAADVVVSTDGKEPAEIVEEIEERIK